MTNIHALPASGDVFLDARDEGRAMRVSWHDEGGVAVLSLWRAGTCVASFQLARDEIPALVESLARGLADNAHWSAGAHQAS